MTHGTVTFVCYMAHLTEKKSPDPSVGCFVAHDKSGFWARARAT